MAGSPGRNHQCSLRSAASKPPGWAASPFLKLRRNAIVIEVRSTQPNTPGTKPWLAGRLLRGAGSGNRCVAPGIDNEPAQAFHAFVRLAVELEDLLVIAADDEQGRARSRSGSASPARSGRPPRDDDGADRVGLVRRGHECGPAPVLAPKYPSRSWRSRVLPASHRAAVCNRSARSGMSKTLERSLASSSSRRSIKSVPRPAFLQDLCDVLVARALPAAAAAVCEQDDRAARDPADRAVPRERSPFRRRSSLRGQATGCRCRSFSRLLAPHGTCRGSASSRSSRRSRPRRRRSGQNRRTTSRRSGSAPGQWRRRSDRRCLRTRRTSS